MCGKFATLLSLLLSFTLLFPGCSFVNQGMDKAKDLIPGNVTDLIPDEIKNAIPGPTGNPSDVSGGAITPAPPRGVTGTVSVGPAVAAATVPVPASGGNITITDAASPIAGLEINIPANSYKEQKQFKVSYAPVQTHSFGKAFNPITPLIKVDNGGAYAEEMMEVKVPVKVPSGYFAMGFLYDEKTKKLEGLPLLAVDENSITVGTRHFSDILFSMIPDVELKTDIDSGFRPGIDDWQFTNRGSYIAPKGHCAGQALSAMWYYCIQPDGKDLTLYGRYDNNGEKPGTPGFDSDDSFGYRFASVVQSDYSGPESGWAKNLFWEQRQLKYDELTWKAFAYSIQLTGEPQYLGISSATGGHAIICYRIKDGNLYVADPNYPGNAERRIEYKDGKFTPYESGANREEIDKGNSIKYDRIGYSAKTAIVDWTKIAQRWNEVKSKTIGNDKFPAYRIVYKDEKNAFKELTDGTVVPDNKIFINIDFSGTLVGVNVFRDGAEIPWDANGKFELKPGNNRLGIWIRKSTGGSIEYVDFKYINVIYTDAPVGRLSQLQARKFVQAVFMGNQTYRTVDAKSTRTASTVTGIYAPENSSFMAITWNGNAFSGSYTGNDGSGGMSISEVKGTISPDGNTVLTFTYKYRMVFNGTGYQNERVAEMELANLPYDETYGAPGQFWGYYQRKGADAFKSVLKITDVDTSTGTQTTTRTYVGADPAYTTSNVQIHFSMDGR